MNLIEQMLKKKIELYEEFNLNKMYKKAVSYFYGAYNLSCALANFKDKNTRKKNRIIARFLLSKQSMSSPLFKKTQRYITEDFNVILMAIDILEKEKEEAGYELGEYYKPRTLGILAHEYPDEN